jgi:plasmid stabilization system protein ParE
VKVVYTQAAVNDLVDAYEYLIGRDDIIAAQRVDAAIARVVERLARREFEGPVATLRSGAQARSWPAPPFRVVYTRDGDVLVVLRVYHQARRPLVDD